jgi:Flp pilus assembly protein CpaB
VSRRWFGPLVLALVTVWAVRAALAQVPAGYGPLVTVPVVIRPVVAGGVVPADGVRLERRPSSTLPDADPFEGRAGGRTAIVPLVPGEVLLADDLAPAGLHGPAALLPPGHRAIAVPLAPDSGRLPLAAGDRVDVLATGDETITVTVAERALVLAVDPSTDTVTIAIPSALAPDVASAIARATVTLALTSP